MTYLRLSGVAKKFGSVVAANNICLDVEKGERISLLGPSGCGKTTLLNLIAGFIPLDSGRIEIGERDMACTPSHKRNLGVVFQNYALFPHLSVNDNVRFGLKMRSVPDQEANRRIGEALELVQLDSHAARYPHQLSGGQQQRVAIARALVIQPELLLLDEPLSNLDAKLRESMRADLLDLLKRLAITTILVTHDQAEALALSDRIAVLNGGKILQVDTPRQIYDRPQDSFVAKFVGESNSWKASVVQVKADSIVCEVPGGLKIRCRYQDGVSLHDEVEILVRIEHIHVLNEARVSPTENSFQANLEHTLFLGGEVRYLLRLGPTRLLAVEKNGGGEYEGTRDPLQKDTTVHINWAIEDTFICPA